VTSCSALKRAYRDQLRRHEPEVAFLLLDGAPDVIRKRQADRRGHFMPTSLLDSQFATLEPLAADERGVTIGVDQGVEAIVGEYLHWAGSGDPG
jgi:gluconokinase